MKRFRITDQDGYALVWTLQDEGASLSIGRSDDCDIVLENDAALSRFHCRVTYRDGALLLQDCGSRNGVYADGERVDAVWIEPGHEYIFGSCSLIAEPDEEAWQPELPPAELQQEEPAPVEPAPEPAPTPAPRAVKRLARRKKQPTPRRTATRKPWGAGPGKTLLAAKELVAQAGDAADLPADFACVLALQVPLGGFCDSACLQFRFRAVERCYLNLLQIDSQGDIELLTDDAPIPPGVDMSFPPLQDGECDFIVAPPFGEDTVLALACSEPCDIRRILAEQETLMSHSGSFGTLAIAQALVSAVRQECGRCSAALIQFVSLAC